MSTPPRTPSRNTLLAAFLVELAPLAMVLTHGPNWAVLISGVVASLIFIGPVLAWLRYGFGGRPGAVVTALFVGWFVVAVAAYATSADLWTPFDRFDVLAFYPLGAFAIMWVPVVIWLARRRRVFRPVRRRVGWTDAVIPLMLTATVLIGLVAGAGASMMTDSAGTPGRDEAHLPWGSGVLSVHGECGATGVFCATWIDIDGSPEDVRATWSRYGWAEETPCTVKGLLGRVTTCWYVGDRPGGGALVTIEHLDPGQGSPLDRPAGGGPG